MDVIFATYWFYPAKTEILLPADQACVEEKLKTETVRFDPRSKLLKTDGHFEISSGLIVYISWGQASFMAPFL